MAQHSQTYTRFRLEHTPDVEIPDWALWLHFERIGTTTIGFDADARGNLRVKNSYIPGCRLGTESEV